MMVIHDGDSWDKLLSLLICLQAVIDQNRLVTTVEDGYDFLVD